MTKMAEAQQSTSEQLTAFCKSTDTKIDRLRDQLSRRQDHSSDDDHKTDNSNRRSRSKGRMKDRKERQVQSQNTAHVWRFRYHNCSFLYHKFAATLGSAEVMTWAESSLFAHQQKSLQLQAAPHASVVFGMAQKTRKNMHIPDSSGVATCAHKPFAIKEETNCRGPLFSTGRYVFTLLYLPNNVCFRCITVYNYASSRNSGCNQAQVKQASVSLFKEIFDILNSF